MQRCRKERVNNNATIIVAPKQLSTMNVVCNFCKTQEATVKTVAYDKVQYHRKSVIHIPKMDVVVRDTIHALLPNKITKNLLAPYQAGDISGLYNKKGKSLFQIEIFPCKTTTQTALCTKVNPLVHAVVGNKRCVEDCCAE